MTPIKFSRLYRFDPRIVDGSYFSGDALQLERGDVVGVLLLNLGGPHKGADVQPFLYNLFMDPAIIDIPLRGITRHLLCKLISTLRAKKVGEDYAQIDPNGGSPINRLTEGQAQALQQNLNDRFGDPNGITFRTYTAMRYWHPFSEEAAEQMKRDGVTKLVFLPLYPHYSKTTTGASLVYWKVLEEFGEIPVWPSTYVQEYTLHPRYLQALSKRIDEGLAKFPEEVRSHVHILFSAHGTPLNEMLERGDPYCCLVHSTVEGLMRLRRNDHPFDVAFQSKVGPAKWLTPSTPAKLKELGESGKTAVLVVPIAFVTDHIETAFELDVEVREEAKHFGIEHYEVTGGLNDHPEFIAALTESVAAQLRLNGIALLNGVPAWPERLTGRESDRKTRCENCQCIAEGHLWPGEAVVG
ncbi:MAG: ferrochelatase [Candidatus Kapaibacterium sp.]